MNDSEWIAVWMRYAAAALAGITSRGDDDRGDIADVTETAAKYADAMMREHMRRDDE